MLCLMERILIVNSFVAALFIGTDFWKKWGVLPRKVRKTQKDVLFFIELRVLNINKGQNNGFNLSR